MSSSTGQAQSIQIAVTLSGLRPVMFDRYAGDNKTELAPEDKVYLDKDGETLVLPAENLFSFLTAVNTTSAPKRLLDKREFRSVCAAFQSFVDLEEQNIPFTRNGKKLTLKTAGLWLHRSVARLDKGIPNPKVRPVLDTPWELSFALFLMKNPEVNESLLKKMFVDGGLVVGIGTYRGRYGKFEVTEWETKNKK